jgi:hypothetical protein
VIQGQPRQTVHETPISKTTRAKWTGGVAQGVEQLLCKHKVLSSNLSPIKKKFIEVYVIICVFLFIYISIFKTLLKNKKMVGHALSFHSITKTSTCQISLSKDSSSTIQPFSLRFIGLQKSTKSNYFYKNKYFLYFLDLSPIIPSASILNKLLI